MSELVALAFDTPDAAEQMRDRLERLVGAAMNAGAKISGKYVPIPDRALKRLQALGYIK